MSLGTRKYGRQSNKTDSSTSLASQTGNNGKPEPSNTLGFGKRTSVVFEEPRAPTITTVTSHSSTSTAPPGNQSGNLSRAAMATSKTVNGILRKGSVPGDDIVPSTAPQPTTQLNLKLSPPGKNVNPSCHLLFMHAFCMLLKNTCIVIVSVNTL